MNVFQIDGPILIKDLICKRIIKDLFFYRQLSSLITEINQSCLLLQKNISYPKQKDIMLISNMHTVLSRHIQIDTSLYDPLILFTHRWRCQF
jgi:hypothetical protein